MSRSDYLMFGGHVASEALDLNGTRDYLVALGFGGGELERARAAIAARTVEEVSLDAVGARYCDFCLGRIMGGEYDLLKDGRERCSRCSKTVLSTHEQFVETFQQVQVNMEMAFSITIEAPPTVKMVNAREIARTTGETFTPTGGVDPRVLGFVKTDRSGQELWIENGAPRMAAITTMAHELTHVWQHAHWEQAVIDARYGKTNRLAIYEGMATWAQVQYLLFIRDFDFAFRQHTYALAREDVYGDGYRVFLEHYPMSVDGDVDDNTPFTSEFPL